MTTQTKDRKTQLLHSTVWNGIDFVEITSDQQTALRIHFVNNVPVASFPMPTITGGESIPTVSVASVGPWGTDGNHAVIDLTVVSPGDFSQYTLSISTANPATNIDGFFSTVTFSFKDRCPSDLDLQPVAAPCPLPDGRAPAIDYLAKDFLSFRQALLDFSSLNYPEWQERSEADFGVMFVEALSALADELSYTQDRIAAEAALATVTQRRSLVRLARMVDYEPGRATASRVDLQFTVAASVSAIAHGLPVYSTGPDGVPIVFETGNGLLDVLIDPDSGKRRETPATTIAAAIWNPGTIQPYWLDDSQRCLAAGSTTMLVLGRGYGFQAGQRLLIETQAASSADPSIRQIVTLALTPDPAGLPDPLFVAPVTAAGPPFLTVQGAPLGGNAATAYTRISWTQPLLVARDLTVTTLSGNIVPATQGQTIGVTVPERFAITGLPDGYSQVPLAIARTGPRALPASDNCPSPDPSPQYLYCLNNAPLAWLVPLPSSNDPNLPTDPDAVPDPQPDILLTELTDPTVAPWSYVQSMLEAEQFGRAFTLDPAKYQPICTNSDGSIQYEYIGDTGDTIRFGDGTFGQTPVDRAVFGVIYRIGGGASGNVAAEAINQIRPGTGSGLLSVTNPLPATGGADQETAQTVRRLAPQRFREIQYRAVIPQDYQDAAQTLPWIERAGTVFRWTGSWLSIFTTPDPVATELPTVDQQTELIDLLNRYRMAGYESYVPAPQYVSLDIEVTVCAQPTAFRSNVESAVAARLNASSVVDGIAGFFNHGNFTFGQPLELSRLERAVQLASGVAGVMSIFFRVRGRTKRFSPMPDEVGVGSAQIIRCDNDPSVPEHGSIRIIVMGGK